MVTSFATVADLVARGRPVPSEDTVRAQTALADASDYLRGEIGWQVYPPATVTVPLTASSGRIQLPGSPVTGVTSVAVGGQVLSADAWRLNAGAVVVDHCYVEATVTYTVGWATPPSELVRWTCVLAAEELERQDLDGVSNVGATPASVAVDDFRIGFSTRQQAGDSAVPDRVLDRLRRTYGSSGVHTS